MPNRDDWKKYYGGPDSPEVLAREARDRRIWRELNRLCPPGPGKAQERARLLAELSSTAPKDDKA